MLFFDIKISVVILVRFPWKSSAPPFDARRGRLGVFQARRNIVTHPAITQLSYTYLTVSLIIKQLLTTVLWA